MRRLVQLVSLALCVLGCVYTAPAFGQNVVNGTIKDPNGNAYANGNASALLAVVSGQVQPPPTNVTTNAAGFFTMTLVTGSYSFIVCAAPTGLPPVNPVANPTPKQICFQSAPILINTNPQDVSTTLNAIALSLGPQGSSAGGVSNPSSINGIIFVDGVTYKQSPDIGVGINAAYAALPSTGGTIKVPAGTYNASTTFNFSTASKPVKLECDDSVINWVPTTGNMSVWNYGSDGNNPALHDRFAGIYGCQFIGPNSGTSVGVVLGGTNGAEGFTCDHCQLRWIVTGTAVLISNYAWGIRFDHATLIGAPAFNFPNGTSQSGEQLNFWSTLIQGTTGNYTNSFLVQPGGCCTNLQFLGGSFDDAQVVLGVGAHMVEYGTHHENPGQRADSLSNPAVLNNNGTYDAFGIDLLQDASASVTKGQEISFTGTATGLVNGGYYHTNATIANLITNSGSNAVDVSMPPTAWSGNGFTFVGNNTGSGSLTLFHAFGVNTTRIETLYNGNAQNWEFPNAAALLFGNATNQPVLTGTGACATFSTQVGGGGAGTFKCTGTSGAATITLTFYNTTSGWGCDARDLTTTADTILPTGGAVNTCTFSAAAIASNDVIRFLAFPLSP